VSVEIFVPWMGPSSNECYSGRHWAKRNKDAHDGHLVTLIACKGVDPIACPVVLIFTPFVGKGQRRFDTSNYSYSAKIIEDGLVLAGVLEGDGPDQVLFAGINTPIRREDNGFLVQVFEAKKSPATNYRAFNWIHEERTLHQN